MLVPLLKGAGPLPGSAVVGECVPLWGTAGREGPPWRLGEQPRHSGVGDGFEKVGSLDEVVGCAGENAGGFLACDGDVPTVAGLPDLPHLGFLGVRFSGWEHGVDLQ